MGKSVRSTDSLDFQMLLTILSIWVTAEQFQNFVPAHRGIRGNEAADRLAKNGAKRAVRVIPY